ncbi:aldehyde dehydrogenase family protein [Nocardia sp. CA-135953]|uniref:aldehyde dehydrogenase family protein n=1 Tax=Nocardia sp. CA-135953 TaxID=3239978 RepID=UPI003D99DF4D
MTVTGPSAAHADGDEAWLCSAVTGLSLGRVPLATDRQVLQTVDAARRASLDWAAVPAVDKHLAVHRVIEQVTLRQPEIARLLAEEVGVSVTPLPSLSPGFAVPESRAKAGVCGVVVTWNDPLAGTTDLIVPLLLAGRSCVVVVAPEIALSGLLLGEAVRAAGLPDGLVTVLPGGAAAVDALLGSAVEHVIANGYAVVSALPSALLSEDAPLDGFLAALPWLCLAGNGQYGRDRTRVLVPRKRFGEIVDAVTDTVAALAVGDPRDPDVAIGPVLDDWHVEALESAVAQAWRAGARITLGGTRDRTWDDGCFLEPTVVADPDPLGPVAQPPVPGPLVALLPYDGGLDGAQQLARRAGFCIDSVWTGGSTFNQSHARKSVAGTTARSA